MDTTPEVDEGSDITDTEVDEDSDSDSDGTDTDTSPVQRLSIQWLDLKRVPKNKSGQIPNTEVDLGESVKNIIDIHNGKKESKNENNHEKYIPGPDPSSPPRKGYSLQRYTYTKSLLPKLVKKSQYDPIKTTNTSTLYFFYRSRTDSFPTHAHIVALSSGNAWEVVRPYVDHSFPIKICENVANPRKIMSMERRHILMPDVQTTMSYPSEHCLYSTSNLYYFVEVLKSEIKNDSSLHNLVFKRKTDLKRLRADRNEKCKITFRTAGIVKIERQLSIEDDYPDILNLFAECMGMHDVAERKDVLFDFLHFLQLARFQSAHLDNKLISHIFASHKRGEEMPSIYVRHNRRDVFLSCNSFEIKIKSGERGKKNENISIKSNPPKVEEVVKIIAKNAADEEEFQKKIKRSSLIGFDDNSEKITDLIINCIEAQFQYEENTYFKMRKVWYELQPSYLALLYEDFRTAIKNILIEEKSEWWLDEPWKESQKEGDYNESYVNKEKYLVFDKILPYEVESCDILRYTESEVYLYHVKNEIGRAARVNCSQILMAATLIRNALITCDPSDYLEKLWKEWQKSVQGKLQTLTKESFFDIFRRRKLIFVYAYASIEKSSFREKLKKSEEIMSDRIIEKLKLSGYLDSRGRLTGKFISISTKPGKVELAGESETGKTRIYKQLKTRILSKSTIAMIEIVNLTQDLKSLNFELKICEIREIKNVKNQLNSPNVENKLK